MMRPRIRYTDWPQPAVELTDTPRPGCWDCAGAGVIEHGGAVDDDGTVIADPLTDYCDCWDPARAWLLTYVPRWLARRWLGWTDRPYFTDTPTF